MATEWLSRAGDQSISFSFFFNVYPPSASSTKPPPQYHVTDMMFHLVANLAHRVYSVYEVTMLYHGRMRITILLDCFMHADAAQPPKIIFRR